MSVSERFNKMPVVFRSPHRPIPPVKEHTEFIEAGPLTFGVEYRLLTNEIYTANFNVTLDGKVDDRGVTIHVFGRAGDDLEEHLRFDAFDEDPHYHYIHWSDETQDIRRMDPVADGDPLAWSLERIRTRLPQMLKLSGAMQLAEHLDIHELETALPRVAEAAYRAKFQSPDKEAVRSAALKV